MIPDLTSREDANKAWRLCREACLGKYRTNRNPVFSAMAGEDIWVRYGALLWGIQLYGDDQIEKRDLVLAMDTAFKFEPKDTPLLPVYVATRMTIEEIAKAKGE